MMGLKKGKTKIRILELEKILLIILLQPFYSREVNSDANWLMQFAQNVKLPIHSERATASVYQGFLIFLCHRPL